MPPIVWSYIVHNQSAFNTLTISPLIFTRRVDLLKNGNTDYVEGFDLTFSTAGKLIGLVVVGQYVTE